MDLNSHIDEVTMLVVVPLAFLMIKLTYVIIALLIIGGIVVGKSVMFKKKQDENVTDVLIENDMNEKLINPKTSDHER